MRVTGVPEGATGITSTAGAPEAQAGLTDTRQTGEHHLVIPGQPVAQFGKLTRAPDKPQDLRRSVGGEGGRDDRAVKNSLQLGKELLGARALIDGHSQAAPNQLLNLR